MSTDIHAALMNEVRYAERLCQRTTRLYRRVQTIGIFVTVVSGSAALSTLTGQMPAWVVVAGTAGFAVFGAMLLAVRPADKAAVNEADQRRYAKLRTDGFAMDAAALRIALSKAQESDAAEVELLRAVAYNDVGAEANATYAEIPLTWRQDMLAAMA